MVTPINVLTGISLAGKRCLVTGGSQGLGKQITKQFLDAGAKVAICSRSRNIGEKTANELGCFYVPADVSKVSDCQNLTHEVEQEFGSIDCLVNAAAVTHRGKLCNTTEALWDEMMNGNLKSVFFLTQSVSELMKKNKTFGSIINISSVASHGGATFITPYSISKGGVNIMTKLNASELQPFGIRVNGICMGWTLTDNEHKLQADETGNPNWLENAEAGHPAGRLLRASDIGNMCTYLCSDASNMITGSLIDLHPEMITGMMPRGIGE